MAEIPPLHPPTLPPKVERVRPHEQNRQSDQRRPKREKREPEQPDSSHPHIDEYA